eukprot:SAG11_NODE_597_length_8296_cov_12.606123_10_plen_229_part_00
MDSTEQHPLLPIDLSDAILTDASDPDIESRLRRLENLHIEVYDCISQKRLHSSRQYDRSRRPIDPAIKPGAKVWLDLQGLSLTQFNLRPSPKWNPLFYEPFLVLSRVSANSFRLKLLADCKIHDVFHVSRLRPHTDPEFVRRKANPLPKILEGAEIYEIERIIDHDFTFGTQWYKIAWKGFSEIYESTWEPRHELMKNAKETVLKYERKKDIILADRISKKARKRNHK